MIKKESNLVLRQFAYFFGGIGLMTLLLFAVSQLFRSPVSVGDLFFSFYQVGLLVFGMFTGITLFYSEMKDQGMEYLLTLPYSRARLSMQKIGPRFGMLVLGFLVYLVLIAVFRVGADVQYMEPLLLFCLSTALFVIGMTFSLIRGSLVVPVVGTVVTFGIYLGVIYLLAILALILKTGKYSPLWGYHLLQDLEVPGFVYLPVIGLIAALFCGFVYAFQRFDLKPRNNFVRRYVTVFAPAFIIIVCLSLVFMYRVNTLKHYYYLAGGGQLVDCELISYDYEGAFRVYSQDKATKLKDTGFLYLDYFTEKNNMLYNISRSLNWRESRVIRLNPADSTIETLYKVSGKDNIDYRVYTYCDTLAFFETSGTDTTSLVLMDISGGTAKQSVTKIKMPAMPKKGYYSLNLIGADEVAGRRFWLAHTYHYLKPTVFMIQEDGRVEEISKSIMTPIYVNGILITDSPDLITSRKITPEGVVTVKEIPAIKGLRLYSPNERNLDHIQVNEIYGTMRQMTAYQWKKVFRLDLATLELIEIQSMKDQGGYFYYAQPGQWLFIETKPGEPSGEKFLKGDKLILSKMFKIAQGNLELMKEFEPVYIWGKNEDSFDINNNGIVVQKDRKVTVFAFPGLKELTFKGLND